MHRRSRSEVFFDKDGTLIDDVPYNVDPARVTLAPGAATAVRRLADAGYALVVVTNQSGVARGLFPEEHLQAVADRLRELLAEHGAPLAGYYYCPHHPAGCVARYAVVCSCRKPAPAMILRAADELVLDLSRSWAIGDILDDVCAGRRAGCRTILIDTGHETEWQWSADRCPEFIAPDLAEAARYVLAQSGNQRPVATGDPSTCGIPASPS